MSFSQAYTHPTAGLNGDQAAERFAQGFDMVSVTTDIDTLSDGFTTALLTATGKFGAGFKGNLHGEK